MIDGAQALYDCNKAFAATDPIEKLKQITVSLLMLYDDDNQFNRIARRATLSVKLLRQSSLKVYPGYPDGMATTHANRINQDLLAFVQAKESDGKIR